MLAGIDVTDNDVVPANSDVTDNGVVPAGATDDSVGLARVSGNGVAEVVCGNSAAGIATSVLHYQSIALQKHQLLLNVK